MRLSKLVKSIFFFEDIFDHKVNGLENDSRLIRQGYVFVAIKGKRTDGHKYITEAINRGAKTIIYEGNIEKKAGVNFIKVSDSKKALALLANAFYHHLTSNVKLIGVTGTNGKTTISTLLANFLNYLGLKSLLIGSNGIFFGSEHYETENTTPDILFTLKIIDAFYKKGCRYVFMEVSSQAIAEMRVYGFDFNVGVFSNLTPEHLDYHKNMTDYKYTKGIFLESIKKRPDYFVILNKDDLAFELYNRIAKARVITYGIKKDADFMAKNIFKSLDNGNTFKLCHNNQKANVKTYLMGEFNIYNILACFAVIDSLGFKEESFITFLKIYVKVMGRMETLKIANRLFIVDYAHTPDGVLNVCQTLHEYASNKVFVVIGCGGNRDKEKRPIIGQIVCDYAYHVIFTNDNPRDENDVEIMMDILRGTTKNNYEIIYNREEAILKAIKLSSENDIVAVLGKGAETSQIINEIKHPFNDIEVIKRLVRKEGLSE